ncbi:MAG: beta-N-acetylhexosaminidase [Pseudomonadota bacterium]
MTLAAIFGLAGPSVSDEERRFFQDADPLGFILFARNIENGPQVTALTAELRSLVSQVDAPVLIDQEGGRVQRLRSPEWREAPAAAVFGQLALRDLPASRRAVYLNHRLLADELVALGITVDCAPVVDLRHERAHDVIGDRAFGADPDLVAELGRAACEGLADGGVQPIIKHIPGHGRGLVDSHLELPVCDASEVTLVESDFVPFRLLRDRAWAMTAHVVYSAVDPDLPATTSPTVMQQVIRGSLGFDGVVVSDDLSMQALSGSLADRAAAAMAAGCDLALHCNGDLSEMQAVASAVGEPTPETWTRLQEASLRVGPAEPLSSARRSHILAELESYLQLA